jgi:hypothetical protein
MRFLIFVIVLLEWLHASKFGRCSRVCFPTMRSTPQGCGADSGCHTRPVTSNNGEQPTKQACVLLVLLFIKENRNK